MRPTERRSRRSACRESAAAGGRAVRAADQLAESLRTGSSEIRGYIAYSGKKQDEPPIVDTARERGLLVNRTNEKVVRMLPPLTIEAADIDRAVDILDEVFATVEAEVHA